MRKLTVSNLNVLPLTETTELKDFLVNLAVQAMVSFKDGVQVADAADFFDDLLNAAPAFKGLAEGFPKEAETATPEQIDEMFADVSQKFILAGLNPLVAGAIEANLKSLYYIFAAVKSSKVDLIG